MTAATLARPRSPALQRLRSRLFDVILVLWTAAFAPAALVLALLGAPERAVRRTARAWAGLRGIMWFEHDSDESTLCDWKIQDLPDAIQAFAALASDPYFGG